jgi:hypothetical protein
MYHQLRRCGCGLKNFARKRPAAALAPSLYATAADAAPQAWPSSSRVRRRQIPWQQAAKPLAPSQVRAAPWFRRLVRRIGRAEAAVGFTYDEGQIGEAAEEGVAGIEPPAAAAAAGKLFRLYKQAGRPGREQRARSDWRPDRLALRAEHLWVHLLQTVWGGTSPPLSTRLERLEALAGLARPGAAAGVQVAIDALAAIVDEVHSPSRDAPPGDAELEHLAVAHAAVACAASWCLSVEQGRAILDLARDRAGVDVARSPFVAQVAALLGEASADFEVVAELATHLGVDLTPPTLVAWLQALGNTVHGQGTFQLAERAFAVAESSSSAAHHEDGGSFESDAEVRNALIVVATSDKSERAMGRAFELLNQIKESEQHLSVATCNALAVWCVNWPGGRAGGVNDASFAGEVGFGDDDSLRSSGGGGGRGGGDRFSEVHERITSLEEAMLACKVRPTPALLVNLICAYSHAGDAIRVFSVLQNMKTRKMPVDRRIYLEVVRALGQASVPTPAARELLADPSRVLNGLLQDMHSSGVAADVNFLNGALRVYVGALDNFQTLNRSASAFGKHPADRLHLASLAWELFSTATEGSSLHGAIAPNNVTYNLLIRIFCGANEFERCVNCPYLYSVPRIVGFS